MINAPHKYQKGAALLVLFLILFTVGSTVLLAGFNSNSSRLSNNVNTLEEMSLVKETLLAYALLYTENFGLGPGRLPCKNLSNLDDEPDNNCSDPVAQNGLGRLPLRDPTPTVPFIFSSPPSDIDKKLWYVADENFRSSSSPLNSSTLTTLTIDGVAGYAAVIINPGTELSTQNRLSNNLLASNYLEGGNEEGTNFVNTYPDDPDNFNDLVIGITKSELISLPTIKAAQELKAALDTYYAQNSFQTWRWEDSWLNSTLTYPRTGYIWDVPSWSLDSENELDGLNTAFNYTNSWFTDNNWHLQVNYTLNSYTNATVTFTGCSIIFTFQYGSNLSMDQRNC